MTIPKLSKITKFEDDQITNLNDALEKIEQHATSIQYGSTTPTQLDFGVFYIKDDGTVYVKTRDGTIVAI